MNDARKDPGFPPQSSSPHRRKHRDESTPSPSTADGTGEAHGNSATLEQLDRSELIDLYQVILGTPTRNMSRRVLVTRIRDAVKRHVHLCGRTEDTPGSRMAQQLPGPRPSQLLDMPITDLSAAQLQLRFRWLTGRQTRARRIRDLRVMIRRAERGELQPKPVEKTERADLDKRSRQFSVDYPGAVLEKLGPLCDRLLIPNRATLLRQALYWYLTELDEHELAGLMVSKL